MVDFAGFFRSLRTADFAGPVSLHIEYEISAGSKSERYDNCLEAAGRDLKVLRERMREAHS